MLEWGESFCNSQPMARFPGRDQRGPVDLGPVFGLLEIMATLRFLCPFWALLCAGFPFCPAPAGADEPLILLGTDGAEHRPLEPKGKKAVVLFFVSPYCPTATTFMPELNAIAADHAETAAFYFVHSDGDQVPADILQHAELMQVKVPVLFDKAQILAQRVGAKITPEAVVLGTGGRVLYQGRVNDLYLGPTKRQRAVTKHDLREALKAIASGREVDAVQPPAVGCKIAGLK